MNRPNFRSCGSKLNEVADSIQTLNLQAENVRTKADLAKEMSPVVQNPAANTDNPTASFLLFQKTEIFHLIHFIMVWSDRALQSLVWSTCPLQHS